MPRATAAEETVISVNFDELANVQTALLYAEGEREEESARRLAGRTARRLLKFEDKIYKASPERTRIVLKADEYDSILESMEFFAATAEHMPWHRQQIGDLWSYWVLEGGRVDLDELLKLRKRYRLGDLP